MTCVSFHIESNVAALSRCHSSQCSARIPSAPSIYLPARPCASTSLISIHLQTQCKWAMMLMELLTASILGIQWACCIVMAWTNTRWLWPCNDTLSLGSFVCPATTWRGGVCMRLAFCVRRCVGGGGGGGVKDPDQPKSSSLINDTKPA